VKNAAFAMMFALTLAPIIVRLQGMEQPSAAKTVNEDAEILRVKLGRAGTIHDILSSTIADQKAFIAKQDAVIEAQARMLGALQGRLDAMRRSLAKEGEQEDESMRTELEKLALERDVLACSKDQQVSDV